MSIKIKNANNEWIVDQRALDTSIADLNNNFESTNVEGALRELFDKASKTDTETENSLKKLSEKVKKKIDTVEIDEETNELKFYADGTLVKVIEIPNTIRAMCGEFFCGDVPVGYNVSPLADGDVVEGDFWVDYVTPVNAENMNRIERRLNTLDEEVEELVNAVPPPEISSSFPTDYVCTSDEEIIIDYFFTSHTPGNGTAFINIDGAESEQTIGQGSNRIVVGTLQKGTHVIKVYIKDAKGRFTPELYFTIVSGALEITTEFDLERVYSIADNITIEYTISSVEVEGLMVKQNHNGEEVTIKGIVGKNTWELGQLEIGTHRIKIQANTATLQSNLLEFTIIVGNSSTLFVSSEFNGDNIDVTKRVVLDYRVSMVGISSFTARMYKSNNTNPDISGDTLVNTANASLGVNYWDMGMLEIGDNQIYKIQCSAKGDTVFSNVLVVVINVVSQDYVPYRPVTRGCVANFDAVRSANSNTSANRHIWQDMSGVNTICTLKGFNYSSNGWLDGVLRFGGDAYAEISLQPFKENITNGFTFDILYKVNNVGDIEARVCDCKEDLDGVLVTGFTINTYKAEIATSRRAIKVDHSEDVWTRMTFVVDRQNRFMQVYVNAVLTKTAIIDSDEPFTTEKKIILGARVNDSKGDIINTATCDIQSVRIYNTALTHQEVLQNHISDIHDRDAQMAKRNLNSEQGVMPTMDFYLDLPLDDKGNPISLHHIKAGERVPLRIKFYDPNDIDRSFDIPNCKVQLQGTSSLAYEVKNFKIRLFDENGKKLNLSPKEGWLPESVYTLKANYMDSSHTHNVGLAKFVNNFYDPLPPNEINPMTKKAIDGFPMLLYINGELQGIYDFNLDKGADNNFGFKDYDKVYKYGDCIRSYEISANSDIGAGAFVDDSWSSICSEFEVRFHPDEDYVIDADEIMLEYMIDDDGNLALDENGNPIKAHPELQRLITWVKNCTVKSFKEEAHEYLSIRHCIDYYLLVYTVGAVDNFGKNLMINTWDGKIWYPCFYDMDTILGSDNSGYLRFDASVDMAFGDYNTSNSKLWSTLAEAYSEEIKERYKELRNSFFTMEYFMSIFEGELAGKTGELFYNFDGYTKYLETPAKRAYLYMMNGNMIEWIRRWLRERFVYMDSVFGYGTISEKVTIRANRLGEVTLNLKTYSPQMVTVKFSGAQGNSKTLLVGKEDWVSFTGTITTERDNEITITNAENLMYIDGISYLRPTNLLLGRAEKLVEIDTKGSPYLTRLELTNNRMIQKVDCSNCPKLGDVTAGGAGADAIDLSASVNLRYFDCSDTKISNIKFNPSGGALRTLKINRTPIKEFTLKNQEFLTSIEMEDCMSLGALTVENCNELTTLLLPNSSLRTFSVTNCDKITELDISYNGTMKTLSLDGCPNLLKLKAEGITSSSITYIDLFSCRKLEYLYLSNSSFLEGLRFNDDCSTLKVLRLNGTNIKYIKYGYAEENPTYVDLSPFTSLTSVSFANCGQVEEIRNINLTTSSSGSLFAYCRKLHTITGSLKLSGDGTEMFRECNALVNLPATLDLSGITSMSRAFAGCKAFTMSHVQKVLSNCQKLISMWRTFEGCTSLSGNIPSTLFRGCPNLQEPTYTFQGVTGITGELPEGLFDNNTKLTNVEYMFYNTGISGSLPTTLFAKCLNLTNVNYFVANTKLEIVPNANIFANNTRLQQAIGFVSNCTSMVGRIPELIFQNNTALRYVDYFFHGCTNLVGEIPTLLFFYNANLETVRGVFGNCSGLVSTIPQSLLRRCPKITHTEFLFEGCSGLYGTVPNLLDGNNNVISTRAMFKNCSGIGSMGGTQEIDADFFKGKVKLEDVREMFYNCKYVMFELPYNLFKDCKALKYVSGLFYNCEGLSGSIPENFFRAYEYDSEGNVIVEEVEVPRRDEWGEIVFDEFGDIIIDIVRREKFVENFMEEASYVFQNCRNLSGEIPSSLFSNFQKVLSLGSFFNGCRNLVGGLPDDLFEQCYFVENISNMFWGCYKLRNKHVSEDSPYEFSPDLFLMCRRITNASGFMSMWGDGYYSPEIRQGKIPPGLFDPLVALEDASSMFAGCPIQGDIEDGMFRLNSKLTNISGMFHGSSIDNISEFAFYSSANPPVLYTPLLANCNDAFRLSGLKGTAPRLWEKYPKATGSQCFAGASVDNYADIPTAWK